MIKVTNYLAEEVFIVPISGETKQYQIVPQFSSTLRADLFFWEHLLSIEGLLRLNLLKLPTSYRFQKLIQINCSNN